MNKSDLDRNVLIDICRDGTISYRVRGSNTKRLNNAALPVFSVDTEDDAKALQVHFCALQYTPHPFDGRRWYVLPGFTGELEAMPAVTERFSKWYDERKKPMQTSQPTLTVSQKRQQRRALRETKR